MVWDIKNVRSVLIIDDDPDDYELVYEAMQEVNPGIEVSFVRSCQEALALKGKHVDLVLLDINMPYHDGFTWLKSIRKYYRDLPVVMYTNSLSPAHIAKAYDEGANLYFSKPDSFSRLIRALRALLQMDWSHPFMITEQYKREGRYKTFQLE
jgi:CheY-like chemotaxis protein